MKFRKKPVVIEAFQFDYEIGEGGAGHPPRATWPEWLREAREKDYHGPGAFYYSIADDRWKISTLEGHHEVTPGDWIIQGIAGELYPCKPNIFEATYELADEEGKHDVQG